MHHEKGLTAWVDSYAATTSGESFSVTSIGTVDHTTIGPYYITYEAWDAAGHRGVSVPRTVIVQDTTPPVVTLMGDTTVNNERGTPYIDPGAYSDGPEKVTATPNPASFATASTGSHEIVYSATDTAGLVGTATRTVTVIDTIAPLIILNGARVVNIEKGGSFVDLDPPIITINEDPSVLIDVSGSVNTDIGNVYYKTYTATDPTGNKSTLTRTIVVQDTTPPVITLSGNKELTVQINDSWVDPGANYSATGVSLTTSGTVDTAIVGVYKIIYTAADSYYNTSTATRTVTVVDNEAPIITLNGDNPLNWERGVPYTDASGFSNGGENVTIYSNNLNVDVSGDYHIIYEAIDTSNIKGYKTRIVKVRDTKAPVITLNGAKEIVVEQGQVYNELGASSNDYSYVYSNPLPDSIDTSVLGTQLVTYTATDNAGLTGTATRTISVVDTTPPNNQDTVFNASIEKKGGFNFTSLPTSGTDNTPWFAPLDTTIFQPNGSTITSGYSSYGGTSITTPSDNGDYRLYVIDNNNNVSAPSNAILTVNSVKPAATITYSPQGPYKASTLVTITASFAKTLTSKPTMILTGVVGANITSTSPSSSNIYTYPYTTPAGNGDQTITFTGGEDATGNSVAVNPLSGATFKIDNTPPDITIETQLLSDDYKIPSILKFSSTKDIAIGSFTINHINISPPNEGSLTNFTKIDSKNFTANLLPSYDGLYTVSISGELFKDTVGLNNNAANSLVLHYIGGKSNLDLAKSVAEWYDYSLNQGPEPATVRPKERAGKSFRKSLLPTSKPLNISVLEILSLLLALSILLKKFDLIILLN